jgi:hypothetical protein
MKGKYGLFLCLFLGFIFIGCDGGIIYDPLDVRIVTDNSAWEGKTPVHESTITIQADERKRLYACFREDKIWTDGYNIIEPVPKFQWYYDDEELYYGHWPSEEIKGPDNTDLDTSLTLVQNGKKIKVVINWGPQTGSAETTIIIQ